MTATAVRWRLAAIGLPAAGVTAATCLAGRLIRPGAPAPAVNHFPGQPGMSFGSPRQRPTVRRCASILLRPSPAQRHRITEIEARWIVSRS
jgi:hypothetical protein